MYTNSLRFATSLNKISSTPVTQTVRKVDYRDQIHCPLTAPFVDLTPNKGRPLCGQHAVRVTCGFTCCRLCQTLSPRCPLDRQVSRAVRGKRENDVHWGWEGCGGAGWRWEGGLSSAHHLRERSLTPSQSASYWLFMCKSVLRDIR